MMAGLLGLTQIIGYGTLYYGFAILAPQIAASFGWPVSHLFGALSAGLMSAGLVSPLSGRLMDRHGSAAMMAVGSLVAAFLLIVLALADNGWTFAGGLFVLELVTTLVLYNAAFACLVQTTGHDASRRITHLTLIAGFASTIFWPLTTWLQAALSWREIYGLFALMNLFICFPLHLFLMRGRGSEVASPPPHLNAGADMILPPGKRRRAFILVAAGFSFGGFLLSGILAQMVPLLSAAGLGSAAVAVAALFGPAQVLVRFINMTAGSGRHPITVTLISAAMLPLAAAILAILAPSLTGAVAFAMMFGFGSGLNSIVKGTLPLALFGREAYGETLGRISSAQFVATSVAPFALALVVERFGATAALVSMAAIGALGFGAFLALRRL
jgi:MFS family permease